MTIGIGDNVQVGKSYTYKRYMRDGSMQEITTRVRSRANKKRKKNNASEEKDSSCQEGSSQAHT